MRGLLIFALCATAVYGAPLDDDKKPIAIVSQSSDVNPDGSFTNQWESENGINVQETGEVKIVNEESVMTIRGTVSYKDQDGNAITLSYVADENGFHPVGDHLPTPPPTPEAILRSLDYIVKHPYIEPELVAKTTR